ncbi:hypothetical protein KBC04_03320 [Candidatus Babeliales bacterium]|nr:hypothetical protein [Candidatus Babeliales bacterium]MBP9843918.1 hypothetical protein [Candidatus Babeliales bacterium]
MKKFLYAFCLFLQIYSLQGSWIIVKIDNQSDLTLVQAVRNHDVEIGSISEIFKKSRNQNSIVLPADALFGTSGGCKVIAQTSQGVQFAFSFFGDVTHRVGNGRASFADLDSRNAAALVKEPMMARVFQIHNGVMKLIGYTGFYKENQQFKFTLQGSSGSYQAQLLVLK